MEGRCGGGGRRNDRRRRGGVEREGRKGRKRSRKE